MTDSTSHALPGPVVRLHAADNVVIAREAITFGQSIADEGFVSRGQVAAGHKIAARRIERGEPVLKYNCIIGFAAEAIDAGEPVHAHNIEFREFERQPAYASDYRPVVPVEESAIRTFDGIVRDDGRVATRNYIGICSTVNCSATVVRRIAAHFTDSVLARYPNVDGVAAFSHSLGCGMEMTGEPMALLRRTIAGYARHANLAAVLVIGLGCERNQIDGLMADENLQAGPDLVPFTMQDTGGTRKTIEAGIRAVEEMLPVADRVARQPVAVKHLTVGLQCGGSDGFSSITANPALGAAVDLLARHGGTAILSETPEIYGMEQALARRAASVAIGEKLIERVRWWKETYSVGRDVQINGAVSPGNRFGGLANIFEKSLGSAMKGGTGPLMAVYRYAEPVTESGLVFMDTPGYDPVSVTGQIAGGANLVAFTTGRGSMFGAKPVPVLKLATNSSMYHRLEEDMDINCGAILDGERTMAEMGQDIFDLMIETASGRRSKSELLGLGDHEFVVWDIGIMS